MSINVRELVGRKMADVEKALFEATLEYCNGDKQQTARMLGISRRTVYNKIRDYGWKNRMRAIR